METPTYYAGLFVENDRAHYDKYTAALDGWKAEGMDLDEMTRRLARMMQKEFAAPEAVAEQTRKLPRPYDEILGAGIVLIDWDKVAADFMTK